MAAANRYLQFWAVGSRFGGSDRIGPSSNRGRCFRIGRLGFKGRVEQRRNSPAARSRGGARPEKTELGLPGADSNGGWVGWHLRCMRKPLVAKSGHGDGWSVELNGGGGWARRGLAGASRPGFSRDYSIPNRVQKVWEKVLTLTRGAWWPERLCRMDAGVVVRRRWGGTRGPGGAGLLRAPGPHGSTIGGAAKRTRASGGLRGRRR